MSKIAKDTVKSSKEKVKYQGLNWPEYNRALINRGGIMIYFTEDALYNWYDDGACPARGAVRVQ